MTLLAALGHLANFGNILEIGQGQAHHREQIKWTRHNYALDTQALKIDLLGAARDDVQGTYDTYVGRLDSLLLLNGLLLPFALNTLQFTDTFLPRTEEECPECVEARHPWLVTIWVYLVGLSMIGPFWSILLLLWCKARLDKWLQRALGKLHELRRELIIPMPLPRINDAANKVDEETIVNQHEQIVSNLGAFIVNYEDMFASYWDEWCEPLVHHATLMLWSSASMAMSLVALATWIFLVNRKGKQESASEHFMVLMLTGLLAPPSFLVWVNIQSCAQPPIAKPSSAAWQSGSASPPRRLTRRTSGTLVLAHNDSGVLQPLLGPEGLQETPSHRSAQRFLGWSA